jgi:hypothetical protein
MDDQPIIRGLLRKRAEIQQNLMIAERQAAEWRMDLSSLDRVLKVYDPALIPEAPKTTPRTSQLASVPQGQRGLSILDVLREAEEPLSARQIAGKLAARHGIDVGTTTAVNHLVSRIRAHLSRQRPGVLVNERDGETLLWRTA